MAGDEPLGNKVHSVLQRRNDAQISRAVNIDEQVGVDILVDEHNRGPVREAKSFVDRDDRLQHVALERRIRRQIGARRCAHEDECYSFS